MSKFQQKIAPQTNKSSSQHYQARITLVHVSDPPHHKRTVPATEDPKSREKGNTKAEHYSNDRSRWPWA